MRTSLIAVTIAVLLSPLALGQEAPPGRWWHNRDVVRELALTTAQRERLDAIFRAAAPELIALRQEAQSRAGELRARLDRDTLDRDAIRDAAAAVTQARGALFERELMMLVEMRGTLTPVQWSRFRERIGGGPHEGPMRRGGMRTPRGKGPGRMR
jgi:Spy/CpxP family protein refolding chaperone